MPPAGELRGTVCGWVAHLMWQYVAGRGRGRVTWNATAHLLSRSPDKVRGPDVMVFADPPPITAGPVTARPDLVVEVFGPTDRPGRLSRRVADYHAAGVPTVWVICPDDQTVDVHRPGRPRRAPRTTRSPPTGCRGWRSRWRPCSGCRAAVETISPAPLAAFPLTSYPPTWYTTRTSPSRGRAGHAALEARP